MEKVFDDILIASDGSPPMRNAIKYAGTLFFYSNFHVISCINTSTGHIHLSNLLIRILEERANVAIKEAREVLSKLGVEPITTIARGNPKKRILNYIIEKDIDLLVIRSRTRSGLPRITFGGVGDYIARRSPCPVLILNKPAVPKVKKILCPTDGKTHSEEAGEMAIVLARYFNASLTKFFVGVDAVRGESVLKAAEKRAREMGVSEVGRMEIVKGDPAGQILDTAGEFDLIVMGKGRRDMFRRDKLCMTSREVAAMSPVPVILVG